MKLSLLGLGLLLAVHATGQEAPAVDGYPIANFALTVNASATGDFFGRIYRNPGKLGEWLSDEGNLSFSLERDGRSCCFSDFRRKTVRRRFPFVENDYADAPLDKGLSLRMEAFCPLATNDLRTSALPVLLCELSCTNSRSATDSFTLVVRPAKAGTFFHGGGLSGLEGKDCRLSCDAEGRSDEKGTLLIPVRLKAKETTRLRLVLSFYDKDWLSAADFKDAAEINAYARRLWDVLREKTLSLSEALPKTGDPQLDADLRWYLVPAVSLTKCTRRGEVLTMGYCELNQRDSYWTSWFHLVFFKDAERLMLRESLAAEKPSGKIPTTILPLIERNDDIDINAFFLLREARYFLYYHDLTVLRADWSGMKNAMDWLLSRDTSGKGLPEQVSFWGDWKDVKGVEGRRYSPFSALVYLGALKQMVSLAGVLGDKPAVARYQAAYQKGYDFLNLPTEQGGLWNGNYYCQIWRDGSVNQHILEDQTIGIFLGVVAPERAEKIIATLDKHNRTPYGICETFPYYPASFGYPPGRYHNGGVWPWVNFMDAWARLRMGHKAEAIALVKQVAKADLYDSGDYSPNEYLDSRTGKNLGFQLQGWNAALFGFTYFGLLHPQVLY